MLGRRKGLVLAYGLSLAVAATSAEVVLRFAKPHTTPDSVRAASLEYDGAAYARAIFPQAEQAAFGVNARGYRGEPFALPKPRGTIRIVVLGGSAAFDPNAPAGLDWPHRVQRALRSRGHPQTEVINAGTPGHATPDLLGRLYAEIWMFEPDYVLVYEAWNDIKYFRDVVPERGLLRIVAPEPLHPNSHRVENPYLYYTGFWDRLFCHSQVYVRMRMRYWGWRLGDREEGPPPPAERPERSYTPLAVRQYELNLRLLVDASREIGAEPVLLSQARLAAASSPPLDRALIRYDWVGLSHPDLVAAFADCDAALRRVAAEKKAHFIDVSERISGRSDYFSDHVHPLPAGSAAIADVVTESMSGILAGAH